jgi:hypothetical protein
MFFYNEIPAPTVNLIENEEDFTYTGYSNLQTINPPTGNLYIDVLEGKKVFRVLRQNQLVSDPEIWDFDIFVVFNQPAEVREILVREIIGQFTPSRTYHYDIDSFSLYHKDENGSWQTDLSNIGGGNFMNIASPYRYQLPTPQIASEWKIRLRSRNISGQASLYGTFDI